MNAKLKPCWVERVTRDEYVDQRGVPLDDVTYRYRECDVTTRMAYDPGNAVQVRVDVQPAVR